MYVPSRQVTPGVVVDRRGLQGIVFVFLAAAVA